MVCRESLANTIFLLQCLASGARLGFACRELKTLLEPVGVGWVGNSVRHLDPHTAFGGQHPHKPCSLLWSQPKAVYPIAS